MRYKNANAKHGMKNAKRVTPLSVAIAAALSSPTLQATNYDVTVANDTGNDTIVNTLSWAIRQANVNAGADTITLKTNVNITGVMKNLIDGAPSGGDHDNGGGDVTIQSDDTTRTVDGGSNFRPFFIKSGTVTLSDLIVTNGKAQGGHSLTGGGGAGLGGALFVYNGSVTIQNVTFSNNQAIGGSSNQSGFGSGGGGMFGDAGGSGGGGLFASSTGSEGAYGGTGNYCHRDPYSDISSCYGYYFGDGGGRIGGFGGSSGFGGGGGGIDSYGVGNFGGGGSEGKDYNGFRHYGGFGGGGGYVFLTPTMAGCFTPPSGCHIEAGGLGGFGGGDGGLGSGGGGAGFGGAIFAKRGTITLNNVTFTNNSVTNGTGGNPGEGRGGAIFICTSAESGACSASINCTGNTSFTGNSATTGEVDVFGDFSACTRTLVTLNGFQVNGQTLTWHTGIELDNAGFNVWRRVPGGIWNKLNGDSLIPAQGEESTYTFVDSTAESGQNYEYRLEDIARTGHSTFHYPDGSAPVITLLNPADNALFSPAMVPVFSWEATDYDGFRFQYAYPGSGIQSVPTWSTATTLTPSTETWLNFAEPLVGETVYWRIQGKIGENDENYSDVWQLIVEE